MGDKDETQEARKGDSGESFGFTAPHFDAEEYRGMLSESDIPEAQQRELLLTLWKIMLAFVDLGFNFHPAPQSCGKSGENTGRNSRLNADTIGKDRIDLTGLFNDTTDQGDSH